MELLVDLYKSWLVIDAPSDVDFGQQNLLVFPTVAQHA